MIPKRVTARGGQKFDVDISDKACMQFFRLKHGDRILVNSVGKATVMGVAPKVEGMPLKVLWFAFDKNGGKVSYIDPLLEKDFKKI